MSVGKVWTVVAGGLNPIVSVSALEALLLQQRGIARAQRMTFFEPRYERDIHDPLTFHSMQTAVDRVYHAIAHGERVMVYGDYDADGITSTAILVSTLEAVGAHVTHFLPHREDHGYGLHLGVLSAVASEIDLLITCDCGITGAAEIAMLAEKGVDTIVTDHHSMAEQLPAAHAIIHPLHPAGPYAWSHLCGAGVAWKLAKALLRDKRSPFHHDVDREKWLLDLVALGTVADMVPLLGENRTMVHFGLEVLRRTPRPGLRALFRALRLDISTLTEQELAFRVIPLLNAAGRMDHAEPAYQLLRATSDEQANVLVQQVMALNTQRQTVTRRIVREAEAQVTDESFIFAFSESWPAGVVGLAASQLSRRFNRPAIVIGSNGRHAVGSARSPDGMNVLALLRSGESHLLRLGGHVQAAGFSLEYAAIPSFHDQLKHYRGDGSNTEHLSSIVIGADAVVPPTLITEETWRMLQRLAPFGQGNTSPRFILKNLRVLEARPVGKKQDHLKMTLGYEKHFLEGIGFGLGSQYANERLSDIDVVAEISENEFRGRRSLQLLIEDVAPAGTVSISSLEPREETAGIGTMETAIVT